MNALKTAENKISNRFVGKLVGCEPKESLISKLENSLCDFSGKKFLHTSPHHDDAMLAYFPFLSHIALYQDTKHHFAVMTSGANSVVNEFLNSRLDNLEKYLKSINLDKDSIKIFLEGLASNDAEQKEIAQASRLAKNIAQIYNIDFECADFFYIEIQRCIELIRHDLAQGQTDKIIKLKSCIRDWEEEVAWGALGFDHTNLNFMRLGFYSDKTGQIDFQRDVSPVVDLIKKISPDIITLAWENEVGHPTHIKVCKIVTQAVKAYLQECPDKKLQVWGYRNVWCRFEPSHADLIFPVTFNDFASLKNTFFSSYASQIKAATPSKEYDGPFCDFMQKIMHEQYKAVKSCIGQEYFDKHQNLRVRSASGLCFIKFIEEFEGDLI